MSSIKPLALVNMLYEFFRKYIANFESVKIWIFGPFLHACLMPSNIAMSSICMREFVIIILPPITFFPLCWRTNATAALALTYSFSFFPFFHATFTWIHIVSWCATIPNCQSFPPSCPSVVYFNCFCHPKLFAGFSFLSIGSCFGALDKESTKDYIPFFKAYVITMFPYFLENDNEFYTSWRVPSMCIQVINVVWYTIV